MPRPAFPLSTETHSRIGRANSLSRHYGPDSPATIEAKRLAAVSRLSDYIKVITNNSPPFTAEQRRQLTRLIEGGAQS